ncbi:MAG TPA: hypothetical protein PKV73_16060 [Agriterribacter sp.]|nr:hypothetical protein [Agriterribacter sp.]
MKYLSSIKHNEPPLLEIIAGFLKKQLTKWEKKLSAMQQCMAVLFFQGSNKLLKLTAMVETQTGDNMVCSQKR